MKTRSQTRKELISSHNVNRSAKGLTKTIQKKKLVNLNSVTECLQDLHEKLQYRAMPEYKELPPLGLQIAAKRVRSYMRTAENITTDSKCVFCGEVGKYFEGDCMNYYCWSCIHDNAEPLMWFEKVLYANSDFDRSAELTKTEMKQIKHDSYIWIEE